MLQDHITKLFRFISSAIASLVLGPVTFIYPPTAARLQETTQPLLLDTDPSYADTMNPSLFDLPIELVSHILEFLDCKTLLTCSQVCKLFYTQVKNSSALQYQIQLVIAGMEDGLSSKLTPSDRLAALRRYTTAWKELRWKSETVWPMYRGGVWELSGNIMAQAKGSHTIVFKELGAEMRGIKGREWEYEVGIYIRDFGLDSAQDLLMLIETVTVDRMYRVHLLELSTGRQHPQAQKPILSHSPSGHNYSFIINVCQEYVAVMFVSGDNSESHIMIWNWHTGDLQMHLCGTDIGSFAFLTNRHILVAVIDNPLVQPPNIQLSEPSLVVLDFTTADPRPMKIWDTKFVCTFDWPDLQPWTTTLSILIRSDPAPSWRPQPEKGAPFHISREDRLFVITLWAAEGVNIISVILLVPASTFISKMATMFSNERNRRFDWNEWGPEGSRMRHSPTGHSMIWVCYVHGMKFIAPYRTSQALQSPLGAKQVQVFDFNQNAIKVALAKAGTESQEFTHIIQEPSELNLRGIFTEVVRTSLPYRWGHVQVPHQPQHTYDAVLLSEDAIITVTTKAENREYRILSF